MSIDEQNAPVFDEKEINAILKRAVEMQETEGTTHGTGLTQEELEQLAADVGIDPQCIAAAVAERVQGDITREEIGFWGGPLTFTLEKTVEVEMTEETWESVVAEIRKTFGETGKINQWGRSLEWTQTNKGSSQSSVTITTRNGRTQMHVLFHAASLPVAIYIPVLIPVFVFSMVFTLVSGFSPLISFAMVAALQAVLFMSLRWMFNKVVERHRTRVNRMLGRLERIISDQHPEPATISIEEKNTEQERASTSKLPELEETEENQDSAQIKPFLRSSS